MLAAVSGEAEGDDELRMAATAIAGRDPEATISARDEQALRSVTMPALPRLAVEEAETSDADFEVRGVLGEGGMGRVLLARQRSLDRDVAVKVLRAGAAVPSGIDALIAEALRTGSLEHPNIVPVHALGLDPAGRPVLVMKRIEGVSFGELVRDPAHPAWSAIAEDAGDRLDAELEILAAVCNAAHFAHARGVVHRDIKLDNVMIGSFGEVYLVDWGIAVGGRERERGVTRGAPVGTPAYLAPEMVHGDPRRVDARTDVYLLGATLHAAITGHPRHRGASLYDVLVSAHDSAPFAYGPEVPPELAAICNRAMARDPAARFASALELRRALAAFRRHRGSVALCAEAAARLAEIDRGEPDPRRAHAALTEARFGFTQALRAWPENEAARGGLSACLARMIEHEIAQRDLDGARALLAELGEERPDLAARIEALAEDLRGREERLRALEQDRDLRVGGGAQLAMVAVMPALVIGVGTWLVRRGVERPVGAPEMLGPPVVALAAMLLLQVSLRARLTTAISRRAMRLLLLWPAYGLVHRGLGLILGAPASALLFGDLVAGVVLGAAMGIAVAPGLALTAAPLLIGAVGAALRPDLIVPLFGASLGSSLGLLVVQWRRLVRGAEPRPR
jgi:serine/threonine-protein kinase